MKEIKFAEIEKSQKFLSNEFDNCTQSLQSTKKDLNDLSLKISNLQKQVNQFDESNYNTEAALDDRAIARGVLGGGGGWLTSPTLPKFTYSENWVSYSENNGNERLESTKEIYLLNRKNVKLYCQYKI